MSSLRINDISSEDSNIVTYFQTFEHYTSIVNSKKDLFQALAKIDLIIKDGIDLSSTKIIHNLNDIYNLMGVTISIVECNETLFEDFKDYYMVLCNRLLIKLLVGQTFDIFYNLSNENIDFLWQVQRLLDLLFGFRFTEEIENVELSEYKFPISDEIIINILKFLQLPLFKYMRSDMDQFIYETIDSHIARPNQFFRGKDKRGYIINQEIYLLDRSLQVVLNNCELSSKLFQYFHNTLINKPTHFSYELYEKHFCIISTRLKELPRNKETELLFSMADTIKSLISKTIVKVVSTISSKSGHIQSDTKTGTVQIYSSGSNPEIVSFKAPNWVNYLQYQDIASRQNSDYKTSQHSASTEGNLNDLRVPRGFRQKFKHLFWNNK